MGKGRGGLQAVGTFLTGNLGYGLIGGNQAHKELAGPNMDKSLAGAAADAARSEEEKRRLEQRRRSFLGLNNTTPMGVLNPIKPQRSVLGGF